VNPAKTAEVIKVPFGEWTLGSKETCLVGGGSDPSMENGTFGGHNWGNQTFRQSMFKPFSPWAAVMLPLASTSQFTVATCII